MKTTGVYSDFHFCTHCPSDGTELSVSLQYNPEPDEPNNPLYWELYILVSCTKDRSHDRSLEVHLSNTELVEFLNLFAAARNQALVRHRKDIQTRNGGE